MKILHVFLELKFSGAEIMYVDAAPFFKEKGCELTVLATAIELGDFALNFKNAGFSILHMPMPKLSQYFKRVIYYKSIIKLLKSNKYDVVHIHCSKAMWGFAFCTWFSKTKSVYTFHSVFPTHFYSYPYHVLLRWSAKCFFRCKFHAISDTVYNHETKLYFNKTNKIYNWCDFKKFFIASTDEKYKNRIKLGIAINDLVLISVGGCSDNKRHSDIIKSLPIVLKKIPNTIYLHLGMGNNESKEMNLAESLGIRNRVIFLKNQNDVRGFLIASDIYLMTSRYEGISNTTIEAMACGIPAILYDVPGLRDFNIEGENSILIEDNYYSLANSIIELFENKILMTNMALRAKDLVLSRFNLEKNVSLIHDLYLS